MADYPAIIVDENGDQTAGNTISFTDPDNQPGLVAVPPFHADPTGVTAIMVDSPDGDPVIDFDADASQIDSFYNWDFGSKALTGITSITAVGEVDAGGLGAGITYVTSQSGPPDPLGTYLSVPLVYDSTAVTGGLYAWDGTAYVKIGNLVS